MMTRAYNELYLEDAMRNIGVMSHFCINEYGLTPTEFNDVFVNSDVAKQIAKGNPNYLVGHSGKELADIILADRGVKQLQNEFYSITPEYWAGWVLAYYQWYTAKNFSEISKSGNTFDKILLMYHPLHEADLSKFVEVISGNEQLPHSNTNNMSQS